MIDQSKRFFQNEAERKSQLQKQEEEYERKRQSIVDMKEEREEQEQMEWDELIYNIEKKALSTRMKHKSKIEADVMKLSQRNQAIEWKWIQTQ